MNFNFSSLTVFISCCTQFNKSRLSVWHYVHVASFLFAHFLLALCRHLKKVQDHRWPLFSQQAVMNLNSLWAIPNFGCTKSQTPSSSQEKDQKGSEGKFRLTDGRTISETNTEPEQHFKKWSGNMCASKLKPHHLRLGMVPWQVVASGFPGRQPPRSPATMH